MYYNKDIQMINDFNFKIMSGVYKKGSSYASSVSVDIPKSNDELRNYIDNRLYKNPEIDTIIYFYLQPRN